MWKECVQKEKDGESKLIQFKEDFRDPDGESTVDFTGTLSGELQWIKFGHTKSKFDEKGQRRAAPKLQKTAADFKGKQVGSAGTLYLNPKELKSQDDLSLNKKYVIKYVVQNKNGAQIGETLSLPNLDGTDPKLIKWMDTRTVALQNTEEDHVLMVTVQTENIGITPGTLIASGQVDMSTFELFTKKNAAGQFKQKQTIELIDVGGKKAEFVIQLKYAPKEEPKA